MIKLIMAIALLSTVISRKLKHDSNELMIYGKEIEHLEMSKKYHKYTISFNTNLKAEENKKAYLSLLLQIKKS